MKNILVFGINKKIHSTRRIIEELEKEKIPYTFIKWGSIMFFNGKITACGKNLNIKKYSAVFFDTPNYYSKIERTEKKLSFDLDNEFFIILKQLQENNIFSMNRDFFIEYPFYNKFTQAELFKKKNIPTIPTFHLTDNKIEKVLSALKEASFEFPLVIKESDGGLGEQVWKIESEKKLKIFLKDKRNINLIFQSFIKNHGDFRVLVINKKSVGIIKRSAQKNEWRNNFALGGNIETCKDIAMEKFAEKVCRKMKIDYAGIDILKTKSGYLVIEVNSFGRFEGFEKAYPDKNIGKTIVKYLLSKK